MQIHIKKLDGQKEEFSLEPNDSVMKVKVSEKRGMQTAIEPLTAMSVTSIDRSVRREPA